MKNKVYTVHAFRWGDREKHSYILGIYTKKSMAIESAEYEENWRGGKYSCEIREWEMDQKNVMDECPVSKVVRKLEKSELVRG